MAVGKGINRANILLLLSALNGIMLTACSVGVVPDKEAIKGFQPQLTSLSDVILALGEPGHSLQDDHYLIYDFEVLYAVWCIAGGNTGACFPVNAPHYYCFEFDANYVLTNKAYMIGYIYEDNFNKGRRLERCLNIREELGAKAP